MNHTYQQHKMLYALLNQTGAYKNRHSLIFDFTNNRTSNRAELSSLEINELISRLKQIDYEKRNKMLRKVFHLAHIYGYERYDPFKNKDVIDYDRLDSWMLKYGYLHKPLKQYTTKELPKLVTQFDKVVNSYMKAL